MYPYPVSNSVPGQQGKYRGAKGEQGQEGPCKVPPAACWQMELELCTVFPPPAGSLPPQRSDQHQPASAPPMMQAAAAAAGPPLVAATPYSSYIPYNPQQFPGQPAMMQPMAHYPSQVTEAWKKVGYRVLASWQTSSTSHTQELAGEASKSSGWWGPTWASVLAIVGSWGGSGFWGLCFFLL